MAGLVLPGIVVLGVLIVLAVLVLTRDRGPATIERPACAVCRHEIESFRERCPECGVTLEAHGLVDAAWSRRGAIVARTIAGGAVLAIAAVLLHPFILQRVWWPTAAANVVTVGLVDADGTVKPLARRVERSRWFEPPGTAITDQFGALKALPPAAIRRQIVERGRARPGSSFVESDADDMEELVDTIIGDPLGDAFEIETTPRDDPSWDDAVALIDAVVAGDIAAASAKAGRTRAIRTAGSRGVGGSDLRGGWFGRIWFWRYDANSIEPGLVVPMEIVRVRRTGTAVPTRRTVMIGATCLVFAAIGFGVFQARRRRPLDVTAVFGAAT